MRREDGAASKAAPNKPFHLTPTSLPSVARPAAGERQRSPHRRRTGGLRAAAVDDVNAVARSIKRAKLKAEWLMPFVSWSTQ